MAIVKVSEGVQRRIPLTDIDTAILRRAGVLDVRRKGRRGQFSPERREVAKAGYASARAAATQAIMSQESCPVLVNHLGTMMYGAGLSIEGRRTVQEGRGLTKKLLADMESALTSVLRDCPLK